MPRPQLVPFELEAFRREKTDSFLYERLVPFIRSTEEDNPMLRNE